MEKNFNIKLQLFANADTNTAANASTGSNAIALPVNLSRRPKNSSFCNKLAKIKQFPLSKSTFPYDIYSKVTGQIVTKFHLAHPGVGGAKVCSNHPGH